MARRFLQQQAVLHSQKTSLFRIVQLVSNSNPLKLSKYAISSQPHQALPSITDSNPSDLDFSDLFSSDDDSDLSDTNDNESDHKDNSTSQTAHFSTPKYASNRVIISNIDDKVHSTDLNDLCSKYGNITDIYLPMNRNDNSMHRGFGYVSFENKEQSKQAIPNINGTILHNKVLRAGYAKTIPPKKGKTNINQKQKRSLSELDEYKMKHKMECYENAKDVTSPCTLKQTTINLSGLPSNVTINQIQRMFNGIGKCLSVYLYEYEQFDIKFINAVIRLDLESLSFNNICDEDLIVDVLQPMQTELCTAEKQVNTNKNDIDVYTKRRNRHKSDKALNQTTDENVLSTNLEDILNSEQ